METETNNQENSNQTNNDMNAEVNNNNDNDQMNGTNGHQTEPVMEKKARARAKAARKAQRPAKERKERKAKKASKKVAAPVLEFAELDKAGFRYAEGASARFAIGASKHHGAEFALYSRTPAMPRFKLIAKFDALDKAIGAAEKQNHALAHADLRDNDPAPGVGN